MGHPAGVEVTEVLLAQSGRAAAMSGDGDVSAAGGRLQKTYQSPAGRCKYIVVNKGESNDCQ